MLLYSFEGSPQNKNENNFLTQLHHRVVFSSPTATLHG